MSRGSGRGEDDKGTTPIVRSLVLKAPQIKQLREANNISQSVFARYLNTSESAVEKGETGAKKPSGAALKLLSLVRKHGLQLLA